MSAEISEPESSAVQGAHRAQPQEPLQIIEDEQGLLILGADHQQIDSWLASVGIDAANTRTVKKQSLQKASHAAQALGEAMANDGRWVKMTEESAKLVKQYGSTGTGVVRNKGRIVEIIKFENLSQLKSLANPQMVTGAAGIMAQMALEQAVEEITDYLKSIDKKVDDLLQDQKDQAVADLVGIARLVDETMSIRKNVGSITGTTWSKIADCPRVVAAAQSYALLKIENLAKNLNEASDAAEVETVARRLHKDATEWLGILASAIQLQDKVSVLELDRVLMEQPDTVEQHQQGLQVARRRRLHDVESKLIQLNSSIAESAERMRKQKLLHPFAVDSSLNHLDAVNAQLAQFALAIGIEADQVSIEMAPRWREAAGKFIADGAGTVSTNAKRIGANAVDLGSKAGKAITSGAKHVGQEAKQLRDNIVHTKSEPPQAEAQ